MNEATVVIPCYNEVRRFDGAAFERFVESRSGYRFVLVDDGSSDGTGVILKRLEAGLPERFEVLRLERNRGKAEAVRLGLLRAFETRVPYAGYWDADLATPLESLPSFVGILDHDPAIELVFGARVRLLGRSIERQATKHYLGRVFATVVSQMLNLPIYDTQCGAKLFRTTPSIQGLFRDPFVAGWVFDVEILARLIAARRGTDLPEGASVVYEYALEQWCDVVGSKVGVADYLIATRDVLRIYRTYLRGSRRSA
jgi:glycosyltransferase involved in cell wall biosynthesis